MAESRGTARSGISRRTFLKHGGTSAVGAALLETGAAQAAAIDSSMNGNASEVLGPGPIPMDLSINGKRAPVQVEPATTLVEVLRDHLGLTGTKIGCDRGACSACTVWLDGMPASSCMTLALDARGRSITTIEGLADGDRLHPVQQAFVEHDALQCGFCTPGMIMSCAALLNHKAEVGLDDVKSAVSGHLCRCGTYPNIFKAVLAAAKAV
jgi:xanthine dehydrogenase YagT iron-sulfur-binding subunit